MSGFDRSVNQIILRCMTNNLDILARPEGLFPLSILLCWMQPQTFSSSLSIFGVDTRCFATSSLIKSIIMSSWIETHEEENGLSYKSDERDMQRMGKEQLLRRRMSPKVIVGFASVLGCNWQYALM